MDILPTLKSVKHIPTIGETPIVEYSIFGMDFTHMIYRKIGSKSEEAKFYFKFMQRYLSRVYQSESPEDFIMRVDWYDHDDPAVSYMTAVQQFKELEQALGIDRMLYF